MSKDILIGITDINPEPWQAPKLGMKRAGGQMVPTAATPSKQRAYQEALRDSIAQAYPQPPQFDHGVPLLVEYTFFRRLDQYVTESGRNQTVHRADLSNIVKATEDCLQKPTAKQAKEHPEWVWFFDNDVQVGQTHAAMQEQSIITEPLIIIRITDTLDTDHIAPDDAVAGIRSVQKHDPGNVVIIDLIEDVELCTICHTVDHTTAWHRANHRAEIS